jgi:hypothetical protein
MTGTTARLTLVASALLLGACLDPTRPPDLSPLHGTLARLYVLNGDAQIAMPGAAVPLPLKVLATDRLGNPLEGVSVQFEIRHGQGSISSAAAVTDASGVAASGAWILGEGEGPQHAAARAGRHEVIFTAYAGRWEPCRQDVIVADADGGPAATLRENASLLSWGR